MGRSLYIKITVMLCAIALIGAGITALTAAPHTVRRAEVRIVTSFYPVYIAAQNVANGVDGVEVVNMVDGQFGCLHDYQMSPQDRVVMDSADIFVMNGAGAEPFLEAVLAHHAPSVVITLSQGIPLLESGHVHSHDEEEHDHAHGEEAEAMAVNDHLWVSPRRYRQQIQTLCDGLKKADPVHAQQYEQNAARYLAQIDAIDARLQSAAKAFASVPTVLMHDSLAYLAEDLSLSVAAALNLGEENTVSAATVSGAEDALKGVPFALFLCDSQYGQQDYADLQALPERSAVITVDTCVTGDGAADHWITAMTALCEAWEDGI